MIIGTFLYNNANGTYTGDISTLNFQFSSVEIAPAKKHNDRGPDYRLIVRTSRGEIELGAAWKRKSDSGLEFLSVSLDGPLLKAPLSTALFIDDKGENASLVWTCMKPQAEPQNNAKPKAKQKAA